MTIWRDIEPTYENVADQYQIDRDRLRVLGERVNVLHYGDTDTCAPTGLPLLNRFGEDETDDDVAEFNQRHLESRAGQTGLYFLRAGYRRYRARCRDDVRSKDSERDPEVVLADVLG